MSQHDLPSYTAGKTQRLRLASLSQFKGEVVPLLLATDVASRGLDIPTVDLVVNFDLPALARDYGHRWEGQQEISGGRETLGGGLDEELKRLASILSLQYAV